jgi:hypothetical protein
MFFIGVDSASVNVYKSELPRALTYKSELPNMLQDTLACSENKICQLVRKNINMAK